MVVNGWTLLFHEAIIGQLRNLADASARARKANAKNFRSNSNVKLLAALAKLRTVARIERLPSRACPTWKQAKSGGSLSVSRRISSNR